MTAELPSAAPQLDLIAVFLDVRLDQVTATDCFLSVVIVTGLGQSETEVDRIVADYSRLHRCRKEAVT